VSTRRIVSSSYQQTRSIAAALVRCLRPGDVVLLSGDLGGGKTTFVQGAAAALGSTDLVTSPTFTIVQEYGGAIALVHIDVYRLHHLQELHDLGFDELIDSDRITFIEWGELVRPLAPEDHLEVAFEQGAAEFERIVEVRASGPGWAGRWAALERSLADAEGEF
jgi:tRNA threonylcarbamoyladenosine biosynthesis protein TsaE